MVFKHASGDALGTPDGKLGISVFDTKCACPQMGGDCICAHISLWYGDTFQQPCAHWTFDTDILQPPVPNQVGRPVPTLLKVRSTNGDDCHHNIHNLSDSRAKKLFEANMPQGLGLCVDGKAIPFDPILAAELKLRHYS